ncbi:MAG: hypothetical protein A3B38_03010 [Candidatus Levybacteria bacterium RIFCSPLOWO2_01_FULL_36_13]|nr:MAG: hypothetical protein A2684_04100 [Candidatus Levybacteria bacterium RIFCSPHIGHO2_01_FULL_36_15b]OGH35861.1 MAG: hypothetical protein A3B38_03010 [Candidatus Levybacteria bacterium RIFCSPLOWO2_01_FULL_36_13]
MSKKILITGATGFAGRHLIHYLSTKKEYNLFGTYVSENSKLVLSDIPGPSFIRLNLLDADSVFNSIKEIKPDEIYHLAALSAPGESFEDPVKVLTNNIEAQVNLLEAVRRLNLNSKILIVSSAEIYGKVVLKDLPIDEETPLNPTNPYAVSKIAQDYLGLQYFLTYGLKTVRARPFNHIGPGQTEAFSIAAFAKKIVEIEKGLIEPVLEVGNLDSKRDFTDVEDMVYAYYLLMQHGKDGDVYNIGSGKSLKMSEILDMLLSLSNKKIEVKVNQTLLRPIDNPELVCNPSKFQKLTDWKPSIPIEESLKRILDFWRNKS